MGGSSYDRDVYSSSSYSNWGASNYSTSKMSSTYMDKSMNPKGKKIRSKSKNPIVIMLDVTGSNINFARLVYDKMPMFYGQIEQQGYLKDFDISVCAVGDAYSDDYPLQVADFSKGIEIDSWLEKLVLEGNGGGQKRESYELAAYYLSQNFEFEPDAEPLVLFVGDEAPYASVDPTQASEIGLTADFNTKINGFDQLRTRVNDNVYLFMNKYCGRDFEEGIIQAWYNVLAPEHVIKIKEEKAIVDLMLGVIALYSKNSLNQYSIDMKNRGQSIGRISGVVESLDELSKSLVPIEQINTLLPTNNNVKVKTKGKRI